MSQALAEGTSVGTSNVFSAYLQHCVALLKHTLLLEHSLGLWWQAVIVVKQHLAVNFAYGNLMC